MLDPETKNNEQVVWYAAELNGTQKKTSVEAGSANKRLALVASRASDSSLEWKQTSSMEEHAVGH